jgi:hypothetical protein
MDPIEKKYMEARLEKAITELDKVEDSLEMLALRVKAIEDSKAREMNEDFEFKKIVWAAGSTLAVAFILFIGGVLWNAGTLTIQAATR